MIKIVTDTGVDLPDYLVNKYNIKVLRNWVIRSKDGEEEVPNEKKYLKSVLDEMRKGVNYKTAAISIGEIVKIFDELSKGGDSIIYISLSSKKSRVYDNAVVAKNELKDRDITVIDSKGGIGMQSLIALNAAKAVKEGKSKKEILEIIADTISNSGTLMNLADISFFVRTGRLTIGKELTKSKLKFVVVIGFIKSDGEIYPVGRYRTYKLANSSSVKFVENELRKRNRSKVECIISGLENERAVADLSSKLKDKDWCEEVIIGEFYPEHAAILGPEGWTLGYYIK